MVPSVLCGLEKEEEKEAEYNPEWAKWLQLVGVSAKSPFLLSASISLKSNTHIYSFLVVYVFIVLIYRLVKNAGFVEKLTPPKSH